MPSVLIYAFVRISSLSSCYYMSRPTAEGNGVCQLGSKSHGGDASRSECPRLKRPGQSILGHLASFLWLVNGLQRYWQFERALRVLPFIRHVVALLVGACFSRFPTSRGELQLELLHHLLQEHQNAIHSSIAYHATDNTVYICNRPASGYIWSLSIAKAATNAAPNPDPASVTWRWNCSPIFGSLSKISRSA